MKVMLVCLTLPRCAAFFSRGRAVAASAFVAAGPVTLSCIDLKEAARRRQEQQQQEQQENSPMRGGGSLTAGMARADAEALFLSVGAAGVMPSMGHHGASLPAKPVLWCVCKSAGKYARRVCA